jgi:magnesium transporter
VTIIRGLSLGEIEYRDVPKILWKECRVAIFCGISLAAANFIKLLLFDRLTIVVALVVCITIVVAVLLAMIVGCLLPIGAKRLGFDPAVMASPFITTIVDALSLLVYFQVARMLLGIA